MDPNWIKEKVEESRSLIKRLSRVVQVTQTRIYKEEMNLRKTQDLCEHDFDTEYGIYRIDTCKICGYQDMH